ncbi:helix-turn-helix domain-containing protein [Corynebacterium glyciniphilum]|uniref:helix-turn-helix domain-containing protein n=1 Tax=Corynebacterium glyciniphilum TaxID=1404244 RepID=UPI003FCF86E1
MKLPELVSHCEVRQERLDGDPAYAAEAERSEFVEAVSLAIVRFRAERELSQSALAAEVGCSQSLVARLERGDMNPSLVALQRFAEAGVMEVHIERDGTRVCSSQGPSAWRHA